MKYDVFISHASEDKDEVVRPLAELLRQQGLRIWLDETELQLGDSLRRSIDRGLSESRYAAVILSPSFFSKEWPQKELDGLVAREDGREKVILPVWHNLSREEVLKYSPLLADKLSAPTSRGLQNVSDAIVRAVKSIPDVNDYSSGLSDIGSGRDISELLMSMIDRVTELAENGAELVTGLRTGFRDLDHLTSGLQPGSLTFLAARPGMGKAAFLLNIVEKVACDEGMPTLVFSLSETAEQITDRIVCSMAGIDPMGLRTGRLRDGEWMPLTVAVDRMAKAVVSINGPSNLTLSGIQQECRIRAQEFGALGLVAIESLRNLQDSEGFEIWQVCRSLKMLARELKCPIVCTYSLSRDVEGRPDKRPITSDLPDFEEIDRYADQIFFLYRHDYYFPDSPRPGMAEIIVAKQGGGGPVGAIELAYDRRYGRFDNLVQWESAPPDATTDPDL